MIYVLPQLDDDNLVISERDRIKAAKTSSYRVDSAKTILDIECMDLEYLLHYNHGFFNHCMKVAEKAVAEFIRNYKEMYANPEDEEEEAYYEMFKSVETLDDLLNSCDYFGDDYESRRKEFASTFCERLDYLEEYFA